MKSNAGLSPLTLGFIVCGLLTFAIVVVVRNATADTNKVEQAAQVGQTNFQRALGQTGSNVGAALPEFSFTPEVYAPTLPAPIAQDPTPGVEPLIWWEASATPEPTATATPEPTATPRPTVPTATPMIFPTVVRMEAPEIPCHHIAIAQDGQIFALEFSPHAGEFNAKSRADQLMIVAWCGGQR